MNPDEAKALRAQFPPETIGKLPKGGTTLDYVGHAATTDRLLQVDPEWTWEPFAVDAAGLPAIDDKGNLWIRLTIAGVTRIGVGDGKNAKELIGDALRNAAMRFGVALDLWAKEDLQALHDNNAPERQLAAPERIDATREMVRNGDLVDWVKAQGFGWPWTDEECDTIEAHVAQAVPSPTHPETDAGGRAGTHLPADPPAPSPALPGPSPLKVRDLQSRCAALQAGGVKVAELRKAAGLPLLNDAVGGDDYAAWTALIEQAEANL